MFLQNVASLGGEADAAPAAPVAVWVLRDRERAPDHLLDVINGRAFDELERHVVHDDARAFRSNTGPADRRRRRCPAKTRTGSRCTRRRPPRCGARCLGQFASVVFSSAASCRSRRTHASVRTRSSARRVFFRGPGPSPGPSPGVEEKVARGRGRRRRTPRNVLRETRLASSRAPRESLGGVARGGPRDQRPRVEPVRVPGAVARRGREGVRRGAGGRIRAVTRDGGGGGLVRDARDRPSGGAPHASSRGRKERSRRLGEHGATRHLSKGCARTDLKTWHCFRGRKCPDGPTDPSRASVSPNASHIGLFSHFCDRSPWRRQSTRRATATVHLARALSDMLTRAPTGKFAHGRPPPRPATETPQVSGDVVVIAPLLASVLSVFPFSSTGPHPRSPRPLTAHRTNQPRADSDDESAYAARPRRARGAEDDDPFLKGGASDTIPDVRRKGQDMAHKDRRARARRATSPRTCFTRTRRSAASGTRRRSSSWCTSRSRCRTAWASTRTRTAAGTCWSFSWTCTSGSTFAWGSSPRTGNTARRTTRWCTWWTSRGSVRITFERGSRWTSWRASRWSTSAEA